MANKNLNPVVYGLKLIKNPKTEKQNVSAGVVEYGSKTIDMISAELSKSTTLTATDIKAVIEGLIEFTMLHVASGWRVRLGNLGTFYPTLKNKPAAKFKDWSPSRISGLLARFNPSTQFLPLLSEATFTKGLNRKNQQKTIADLDAQMAAALDANEDDTEPTEP